MPPEVKSAILYKTHRTALVDYANGIVRDHAHAEDVVQDAWLRLDQAEQTAPVREPLRYLYRIVHNLAIDTHRRLKKLKQRHIDLADDNIDAVADDHPSQELDLLARNELDTVMAALNELPERTRVAIEMHRLEGKRLIEIAEHLNISVSRTQALIAEGIFTCMQRRDSSS